MVGYFPDNNDFLVFIVLIFLIDVDRHHAPMVSGPARAWHS